MSLRSHWILPALLLLRLSMPLRGADAFAWGPLPEAVRVATPFLTSLQAIRDNGPDLDFTGDVELSLVQDLPEPGLVLTQVVAANGALEILNAGRVAIEFRGALRAYRGQAPTPTGVALGAVQTFDGEGLNAPISLAPGERLWLGASRPVGYGGQFRPLFEPVRQLFFGQLSGLALADGSAGLDLWVAPGFNGTQFDLSGPGAGPLWTGPGVSGLPDSQVTYRRFTSIRTRSAADWEVVRSQLNLPAPQLVLPLLAAPRLLPVTPGRVRLERGVWSGSLQITEPVAHGRLRADDLAGHPAESPLVSVLPRPALSLTWLGTNRVTEGGPALTAEVRLSEPTPADVTVLLSVDDPGEATVPAFVVIPAGQASVPFQVTPLEDDRVDGTHSVTLIASSAGLTSSPGLLALVDDQSAPNLTLRLPASIEVPKDSSYVPITVEIQLDRPVDRDVIVPLLVERIAPELPSTHPVNGVFAAPAVVFAGRTNAIVKANASSALLLFPSRYRVRSVMAGWTHHAAEILIVPTGGNPPWSVTQASLIEGAGVVSNALTISVPGLLDRDLVVKIQGLPNPLAQWPESVVLPAFSESGRVLIPITVLDNQTSDGASRLEFEFTAPGYSPMAILQRVEDDDVARFDLDLQVHPTQPQFVTSGQDNSFAVYALAGGEDSYDRASFTGPIRVALESGTAPISYSGPATLNFLRGTAPFKFRLTGPAWNVRFRFTLPNGQDVFSKPFEVRPPSGESAPDPTDLTLLASDRLAAPVSAAPLLSLVISNSGPALARRVVLLVNLTGGFTVDGTNFARRDLGSLAALEQQVVQLPLRAATPGLGRLELQLSADNADSNTNDNFAALSLVVTNLPVAGRREAVLPSEDLAYSSSRKRFYVSTSNGDRHSLQELDPTTAEITRTFPVPGAPGLIATTSDGEQLYALVNSGREVIRYDLASGTTNLHFILPAPALDFAVAPGLPKRIVVYTPGDGGVRLFEEAIPRGESLGDYVWLEPDLAGTRVGGYAGGYLLYNPAGSRLSNVGIGNGLFPDVGPTSGFRLLNSRFYFADGSTTGATGYAAPLSVTGGMDVLPDPERDRIYFATQRSNITELASFALSSGAVLGRQTLPDISGRVTRLARWGATGLAFRATGGQIVFLDSPLVPYETTNDLAIQLSVVPTTNTAHRYEIRATIENRGPEVAEDVHLQLTWSSTDLADLQGFTTNFSRPGTADLSLGRCDVQQVKRVTIPVEAGVSGMRLLTATASGRGADQEPLNNHTSAVFFIGEPEPQKLELTVADLIYDAAGDQFIAAVNAVAGETGFGLLTLDPENGRPKRWYPLNAAPDQLRVSDDGSVVYSLFKYRNEVRRLRLTDGVTDVSFNVGEIREGSDFMIPPGRPDRLIVSRRRTDGTPSYVGVSLYQMGMVRPLSSTRPAGVLAPTELANEFYGGNAEGENDQFHRYRIDDQGIQWLGLTTARFHPNTRRFLRLGDQFIGQQGDVHSLSTGAWVRSLPLGGGAIAIAVSEQDSSVITAPPFALWDIASAQVLRQSPIPYFVSSVDWLAVSRSGNIVYASAREPGVHRTSVADFSAARLSVRWTATKSNFAPGDLLETYLTVSNAGPSTARSVSVPINIYPAEVASLEPNALARLGTGFNGQPVLIVDELPAGAEAGGTLMLRAPGGQLIHLAAKAESPTFQPETSIFSGDLIFAQPSTASPPFEVFSAAFQDIAVDLTRGQLWGALPEPLNGLAVFDFSTKQFLGTVPLGFAARRVVLSVDGRFLYAAPTTGSVARVDLSRRQIDLNIPLDPQAPAEYRVHDLAVLPNHSDRLAVSLIRGDNFAGLQIFDGATPHPGRFLPGGVEQTILSLHPGNLVFLTADHLLTTFGSTLSRLNVTDAGILPDADFMGVVPESFPGFTAAQGRAYFHNGRIVDAATGVVELDLPAASLVVPDAARGQIYTVTPLGAGFSSQKYLRGFDSKTGKELWSVVAPGYSGTESAFQSAGADRLVLQTSGLPGYNHTWLVSLPTLAEPNASLSLTGEWPEASLPVLTGSELRLSISNAGPWIARRVAIQLPPGFDTDFTNVTHQPLQPWDLVMERVGEQLVYAELPPSASAIIKLRFAGRAGTGDFAPRFSVTQGEPIQSPTAPIHPIVRLVPLPELSIVPATVVEGDAGSIQLRVRLVLSSPAVGPVVVRAAAIPGTAILNADFGANNSQLLIGTGLSEGFASLSIRGDLVPELTESFVVRVVEAVGARVVVPEATITILDNDWPTATTESVSILERNAGRTAVQIPLRFSAPPLSPGRLQYTTVPGSAAAEHDFVPFRGTLAIAPGQTNAVLVVHVLGDINLEPDEMFKVVWYGGDGVRAAVTATVLIQNDDFQLGLPEFHEGLTFQVDSQVGASYRLERAVRLGDPWEPIGGQQTGTGAPLRFEDPAPLEAQAFYRVTKTP